jgi:DNA-binding IclR family transcriptional regulator
MSALSSQPALTQSKTTGSPSVAARVLQTLELLAKRPLGAAELGRELNVNRSTALRLLAELTRTGWAIRDERLKRYSLARQHLLTLVAAPELPANWSQQLEPVLSGLRDSTGDSVVLAVPTGVEMTYLLYYPTLNVVGLFEQAGVARPMHCSALGKAYLSALPPEEREAKLAAIPCLGGTDKAATNPDELRQSVREATKDGYAIDLEETFSGVRAVATPVWVDGRLVGSAGVAGPVARLPLSRLRELGAQLKRELSGF